MRSYFCWFFSFVILNSFGQDLPKPSNLQLNWQQQETIAFLHFGAARPETFNPTDFNADQIILAIKDAGLKCAILTAKHHAGFCLWPSKFTNFTVARSSWLNGKGDVVKAISEACHRHNIKFGFYLSPWDVNEPSYGTPAYNVFFKNQLKELLSNYGPISEVWFDGAKGRDSKPMTYDFEGYWNLVKQLQPNAIIFSDIGPDVRWVGNERGEAGETCWSTINVGTMLPGKADASYLNVGDPNGKKWIPAEADVSIRPGWFYNPAHDSLIKTGKELVEIYYRTVGRNSVLLLNVPPTSKGIISNGDIMSLKEFRSILDETFSKNEAKGRIINKLTDSSLSTFEDVELKKPLLLEFKSQITFDRIVLQENIIDGQACEAGKIECWMENKWQTVARFTTLGYKRILKTKVLKTNKIRLIMLESKRPTIELSELGLYKASNRE